MKADEIVIARIKGGLVFGRFVGPARSKGRLRLAVGRNRVVEAAEDRVAMATGVAVADQSEAEAFRLQCETLASEIDLAEAWEVACDDPSPIGLADLADLYWGASHTPLEQAALLLHLYRDSIYFADEGGSYRCQPREKVEEMRQRRQREKERAEAASALALHLSQGWLPDAMDSRLSGLLQHVRGYVVHGDNYSKRGVARGILADVESDASDLQRLGFDLLVGAGVLAPDEPIELERECIARKFPSDALAEAASIDPSAAFDEPRRRDLTSIPTVTIDDAGTEDRDDALSLEVQSGSSGEQVYRVGIHIADAGSLIPVGGPIDQEADRRISALYLPDFKIPMLPPPIPNQTGSLAPGEVRPALSVLATITESGEVADHEVALSMIRSDEALSYEDADRAMIEPGHRWHDVLAPLDRVAHALGQRREEAGAFTLDRAEMLISVLESGEVDVRVVRGRTPARRLVAEYMILCNSILAGLCAEKGLAAAYRSQALPDLGDIVEREPPGLLRDYLLMRRLPPADLGASPAPHGGLGVPAYLQVTSPLRRYPDLVMQRQISRFLVSGEALYSAESVAEMAHRAEVQLREIGRIEEGRKRYWFLRYLEQRLRDHEGAVSFEAVILDNRPGRPALLELSDYPFRTRVELPGTLTEGEVAVLRLHGVDLWRREARFVYEAAEG